MSADLEMVASMLETQSLNALVTGFSFASAMSWVDVSRYVVSRLIPGAKNSGIQYTITAIMTTLLSILMFLVVSTVSKKKITKPSQPLIAIR